jgi:hypothetical protein
MAKQCFRNKRASLPVCGVHKVPLIKKQLPNELIAEGYKGFTFLACPVSGTVLDDAAKRTQGRNFLESRPTTRE